MHCNLWMSAEMFDKCKRKLQCGKRKHCDRIRVRAQLGLREVSLMHGNQLSSRAWQIQKKKKSTMWEKKKSIWWKKRAAPSSPKSVKAMNRWGRGFGDAGVLIARSVLSLGNHKASACKLGWVLRLSSLKGNQKTLLLYLLEQVLIIARGWEVAIPYQRQVNTYMHLPWLVLWDAPLESAISFSNILKWRCTLVDPTPLYNDLEKRSKENPRTLHCYTEKDEETCYEWSVSWNNETSLWLKSEYIHEYICDKAADAFPFMIHISNVMSYCS